MLGGRPLGMPGPVGVVVPGAGRVLSGLLRARHDRQDRVAVVDEPGTEARHVALGHQYGHLAPSGAVAPDRELAQAVAVAGDDDLDEAVATRPGSASRGRSAEALDVFAGHVAAAWSMAALFIPGGVNHAAPPMADVLAGAASRASAGCGRGADRAPGSGHRTSRSRGPRGGRRRRGRGSGSWENLALTTSVKRPFGRTAISDRGGELGATGPAPRRRCVGTGSPWRRWRHHCDRLRRA